MTLRHRILLYYSITLSLSLVIVGYWSWFEFHEQRNVALHGGVEAALKHDPLLETAEIILFGGLPAILLGIIGGGLLMRRALRPIEDLTVVLEKTDASNLAEPVQGSGNGDELDRMAAVFNGMKQRLGVSFTQAREFTLHASHELKTPLTIMHSTLEQMLGDAITPAPHRERVASMLEEVQRLSSIVGQLAFLAKADAGLLTFANETVALDELVRDLTEDTTMLAASANITVKLDACEPVQVSGDRMRLRQLLLNLADNAVKHNQPCGSITLSLCAQDQHAVFQITNTGPVLPPELRARVFERFFRGDAAHGTTVEGSGLGLSIAESITQAHGGSIVMAATSDGRTCITLRLPLIQK
ncbi:MAG: sensor histidine kinase [Prosthecobacter sp.]|uniref:sensor histidine kinase n=1 Tax=Prosthecobacter sp. TaxID=1965333 RepID=UPI0039013E34